MSGPDFLTPCQVRMGRAATGWSVDELARQSGVSTKTIRRVEHGFGVQPNVTADAFMKRQRCFEAHGLSFLPEDGSPEEPSVRFRDDPGRRIAPSTIGSSAEHAGPTLARSSARSPRTPPQIDPVEFRASASC